MIDRATPPEEHPFARDARGKDLLLERERLQADKQGQI